MVSLVCATFDALHAKLVAVEATKTKGLPSFSIVGMPSSAISESKERVKSALLSNNFNFPPKRITVNLSPSDLKKEGSHFDLAIALSIALQEQKTWYKSLCIVGELGLDGTIKENASLFALILSLAQDGLISKVLAPKESATKLSNIPNLEVIALSHFNEALCYLKGELSIEPLINTTATMYESVTCNNRDYYYLLEYREDFKEVKGQEVAKRAALIAAAGMHNMLLEGSPGCGKSMIAKRLRYILPPMHMQEILHVAKLDSLKGNEPHFKPLRNFQSPHHSATAAAIFGGGSQKASIGEVGLSHGGILFFDELPHFSKQVLEALREPLEDNKIRISRVHSKVEYDASFMFIGAMNPCPCGNLLHKELTCRCSDTEIQRYRNRLSDPFLDRMDIFVTMQEMSIKDSSTLESKTLHQRVIEAHCFRVKRQQERFNAKMDEAEIEAFCLLSEKAKESLSLAQMKFSLSARAINNIKKVSRTIADLDASLIIDNSHILEALSYRKRN